MANYSINAVTRRVVYTGSAGVGPYAFAFEVLEANDLAVYKNTTLLTLTTDYTVSIGAAGTGSITLVSAATGSDTITITGARDIERTTDFVTAGDLKAAALNEQLDSQIIMIQQVSEAGDRSIKAPVTDPTSIDMTLPAKDTRKGKYLAFNSTTGNPEAGASSDDVATLASITDDIATLADIEDGTDATDAIQTVAGISGNVTTVAGISSNVTTVAGISANVTSVAGNASNINTVAGISGNVTTVAGISADVTAVAADATDIGTVATDLTGSNTIGTVAGIAANVTTVAGISSNVTSVAGNATNINTVAGNNANVTTVAGISANVSTVAGIAAEVSSVAAQVVGYAFSTTTTMADPGSGNVRFNNATVSSVTAIAIDDLDSNGVDQSAYIALFDDSTNTVKGTLVFRTGGGDVATFNITGLTDNTGWFQIAVTHVASSGTFSAAEDCYIGFTRTGDKGADGAGSGDVSGPGAAVTDNAVVRWDGVSGQLVENSSVTVSDAGAVAAGSLTLTTDLAVTDGGTGASDAATARTNLGLGSISTQASTNVDIDGGAIDGTTIGAASAAGGTFSALTVSGTTGQVSTVTTTAGETQFTVTGGAVSGRLYSTSGGGQFIAGTFSNHPVAFYTNSTERIRITSGGNVGIGTPSASTALEVSGTITATTFGSSSQNAYGARTVSTSSPTGGSDGDIWYKY